ncbi:hypothetical protein NQ317_006484 [Molorchus minor]|uniref:Enoyl-[acyl-carrier-protein] reductase, mitochondrial n=1 Tax=Molorchus minor TaxID=1323400 RepID=A0ABQ9J7E3_9CUCU|nr:hypothetical protein NQ317_006484 [Molorchus minor]
MASKLVYSEYGDPIKVVRKESEPIEEPKEKEVLIQMLASPVNPADVNTIQGKYPSKPPLPAVPGNEGVGKIIKDNVLKVPKRLGLVEAATLTVNPCTAYRMLKDFVDLKPGDTVIQNGANSACGQNVIQICRSWGVRTVNIVRARPELDDLKVFLRELGATEILTEEEARTTEIFKSGKLEQPKLALNCVGGKSSLNIMRHLQNCGTIVTYGGMSREPVTVPTSALIFKDVRVRGFWMTRWSKENSDTVDRIEMFEELISLMTSNELQGPVHKMVDFNDYKEALSNTLSDKGMVGKKFILGFGK